MHYLTWTVADQRQSDLRRAARHARNVRRTRRRAARRVVA
jgi:hypothetical protein